MFSGIAKNETLLYKSFQGWSSFQVPWLYFIETPRTLISPFY